MRVAVVGCGVWGATVASRVQQMPGVCVVAVHDSEFGRAEYLSQALGCRWDGKLAAAVDGVDAVVLATPPGSGRYEQVAACVAAGVPRIRLEKPVALSLAEATLLLERFGGRAQITVGHTTLAAAAVPFLRGYVQGADVRTAHFRRFVAGEARHEASAWWDLASHDVAMALHLGLDPRACRFDAEHGSPLPRRTVTLGTGHLYDEAAGTIAGVTFPAGNELQRDLANWTAGRGTPLAFGVDVVRHLAEMDPA